jgi:nitrate reductase gamma subunit
MTEPWLEFARGPLFRFAFAVMVLGLLRNLVLAIDGMVRAYRRTDAKQIPYVDVAKRTLAWLTPAPQLRQRPIYSLLSIAFHIGVLIVPVLLSAHLVLWKRGLGLSIPAIPGRLADLLSLMVVAAGIGLFVGRVGSSRSRAISRLQDIALVPLIVTPFATGLLAAHPEIHPISYPTLMLMHVLSGNLVLLLVPLTKMSHVILWPFTQLAAELAWRFPPDAGRRAIESLGREDRV